MSILDTLKSLFSSKSKEIETMYPDRNDASMSHWFDRVSTFQSDSRTGGTIIIGDSITEGFLTYFPEFFTDSFRNFGIAGDTSIGVVDRLQSILDAKPDKVILAIGTNDLGARMIPSKKAGYVIKDVKNTNKILDSIVYNYKIIIQILTTMNPNIQIFISPVLPVNNIFDFSSLITSSTDAFMAADIKAVGPLLKKRNNEDILTLNNRLSFLTLVYNNVKRLDMYFTFIDSTGQMNSNYVFDGLHLNKEGYKIWKDVIENNVLK